MPELPEVQTTVEGLNARTKGLTIDSVWTDYGSAFHAGKDSIKDPAYFSYFKKQVEGAKIVSVTRKAKNILIHIEKAGATRKPPARSVILIHMKMTGHIMYGRYEFDPEKPRDRWAPASGERPSLSDPFNKFIHFVMTLSSGKQAVLSDMRKFAKVTLIPESEIEKTIHLEHIGPDPLDPSFAENIFAERLSRRPSGKVKQVLMDQSVIAGVGNIYSDEALWRAGLHPEERIADIPDALMKKLYASTLTVLRGGIDFGGDSMSDYRNIDGERGAYQEHHEAYRRTGKPCRKRGCGGTIIRKIVGGRSAHFCDTHQRLIGPAARTARTRSAIKKPVQKNSR